MKWQWIGLTLCNKTKQYSMEEIISLGLAQLKTSREDCDVLSKIIYKDCVQAIEHNHENNYFLDCIFPVLNELENKEELFSKELLDILERRLGS